MRCTCLALILACASTGCDGDGEPQLTVTSQRVGGQCELRFDFPHDAMALYVTSVDAEVQRSNTAPVGGTVYFGLQSTTFPEGFYGPVQYGQEDIASAGPPPSGGQLSDPFPLPLESDSAESLFDVLEPCALQAGTGESGCVKVTLVTIPGNYSVRLSDFSCDDTVRTWTAERDPPPRDRTE